MVDALILGRRGGIDPELQDRFARSGLVHLLSISGFHVGLITAWVFLFCRRGANDPFARAHRLRRGSSAAYVAFLGLAGAGRAGGRARRGPGALPDAAASRPAQRAARRHLPRRPAGGSRGPRSISAAGFPPPRSGARPDSPAGPTARFGTGFWARTAASSLGATLATAPITAGFLGTVALRRPPAQLPGHPAGGARGAGRAGQPAAAAGLARAAEALAAGAGLGLHLLELCAVAGAAMPYGHALVEPESVRAGPAVGSRCWRWRSGSLGERNTRAEAGRRLAWCLACVALGSAWRRGRFRGRLTAAVAWRYIFSTWGRGTGR